MRNNALVLLIALYVLNAVVVGLFYWIFREMNYFSLSETFKGVVATGPIAAFVFLLHLGFRFYLKLRQMEITGVAPSKLAGKWRIESQSAASQRTISGECEISFKSGAMRIDGLLIEGGKSIGSWNASRSFYEGKTLSIMYTMTDYGADHQLTNGLCSLPGVEGNAQVMRGRWMVVEGDPDDKHRGEVTFTRLG